MKSNTQLYFAYGSNLNIAQMRKRCPGAKPFSPAVLHGWKLVERLYADIEEDEPPLHPLCNEYLSLK